MAQILIGVIGRGETASLKDIDITYARGQAIARQNWDLPTSEQRLSHRHFAR